MNLFYCIERPAGVAPHFYPARSASWWRNGPGIPWTTNIHEAAQFATREQAQSALEAANWHVDPSAGIRVTEHGWLNRAEALLDAGYDNGFGVTSLDTLLCEQMTRAERLEFAAFILREALSKQAEGKR